MKVDLEIRVCIVSGAGAAGGKALAKPIAANGALVWILQQLALPPFYGLAQIQLRSAREALQRFMQMFRGRRSS